MAMHCLNCGAEMTTHVVSNARERATYNLCEACGALWLDAGELDKMAFRVAGSIEASSYDPVAEPETDPKPCPRCDRAHLYRVRFLDATEIVLRRCRNCAGFWLDGGQLDAIDAELERDMPVSGRGFADFVHHVHTPYWQRRVQRKSGEAETRREAMPVAGAVRESESDAFCPADGKRLANYRAFGMAFLGCAACKGMFLSLDEMRRLKDKVGATSLRWMNEEINQLERASAVATGRRCPRDPDARMAGVILGQSGLMMDVCPRCHGVWLDQDEFDEMVQYLRRELDAMSPRDFEAAELRELKAVAAGSAEGRGRELRDAMATINALLNTAIAQHPTLARKLLLLRAEPPLTL
jgi:Zn-finger nucleic acid-binding protein